MLTQPEFYIGRPTWKRFLRTCKIWGYIILFFLIIGRPYILIETHYSADGTKAEYIGFGPVRYIPVKRGSVIPLFRLLW
jgi:hypothetical protein